MNIYLKDLPEQLISQLSKTHKDNDVIFNLLKNGPMSLDELLIQIYKNSGEVVKRTKLNSKIYRLVREGVIEKAHKKGTFKLVYKDEK